MKALKQCCAAGYNSYKNLVALKLTNRTYWKVRLVRSRILDWWITPHRQRHQPQHQQHQQLQLLPRQQPAIWKPMLQLRAALSSIILALINEHATMYVHAFKLTPTVCDDDVHSVLLSLHLRWHLSLVPWLMLVILFIQKKRKNSMFQNDREKNSLTRNVPAKTMWMNSKEDDHNFHLFLSLYFSFSGWFSAIERNANGCIERTQVQSDGPFGCDTWTTSWEYKSFDR